MQVLKSLTLFNLISLFIFRKFSSFWENSLNIFLKLPFDSNLLEE